MRTSQRPWAALTALTEAGVRPLVSQEQAQDHLRETLVALAEPAPTSPEDGAGGDVLFHEGWQSATLGTYAPPSGDNVWVAVGEPGPSNPGVSIPISSATEISFVETGSLVNPETGSAGCLLPPCGDHTSLLVSERRGTRVAYALQRAPGASPQEIGSVYREIFLDPHAATYSRNLYEDFLAIPAFDPDGAELVSVEFRVDEHGSATLDDLVFRDGTPSSAPPDSPGGTDELPPEDSSCDFFATVPGSTSFVAVDNGSGHAIEWSLRLNGNDIPLDTETRAGACEGIGVPAGSYVAEIVSGRSRSGDNCTGPTTQVGFSLAGGETHTVTVTDGSF